ncbi:MAG: asparagine synthetase B, partial [Bacteroidota bacterium]
MRRFLTLAFSILLSLPAMAQDILVPMDSRQSDHIKAYGVAFWTLEKGIDLDWLLNYRGGSFLFSNFEGLENELRVRGVYYETLSATQADNILREVQSDAQNMDVVRLEKAPRIAVYAPSQTMPWDDAVLIA